MSWWNVAGHVSLEHVEDRNAKKIMKEKMQDIAFSEEREKLRSKIKRWQCEGQRLERLRNSEHGTPPVWSLQDEIDATQGIQHVDRKLRALMKSLEDLEAGRGSWGTQSHSTVRTSTTSGETSTFGLDDTWCIEDSPKSSPKSFHSSLVTSPSPTRTPSSSVGWWNMEAATTPTRTPPSSAGRQNPEAVQSNRQLEEAKNLFRLGCPSGYYSHALEKKAFIEERGGNLNDSKPADEQHPAVSKDLVFTSGCAAFKSYERDMEARHDAGLACLAFDAERCTEEQTEKWKGLESKVEQKLQETTQRREEARLASEESRKQLEISLLNELQLQQQQLEQQRQQQKKCLDQASVHQELEEQRRCLAEIEEWQAELDRYQQVQTEKHMAESRVAHEESQKNQQLVEEIHEQRMRLARIEEWQSELNCLEQAKAPEKIASDLNRRHAEVSNALARCAESDDPQRQMLHRELCVLKKQLILWRGIEEAEAERQSLFQEQQLLTADKTESRLCSPNRNCCR